jgi:hypothetical protein
MGIQFLEGKTMTKRCDPGNHEDFDLEAISFADESAAFDMDLEEFSDAILPSFKNIDVDDGIFRPHTRARGGVLVFSWQNCGAKTRKGTPCRCKPLPGKRKSAIKNGLRKVSSKTNQPAQRHLTLVSWSEILPVAISEQCRQNQAW